MDIQQWVSTLSDDRLAQLKAMAADELYRREQEVFNRQAAAPTDEVGREFAAIQVEYAEKKAKEAQERTDTRHQRMLDVRDRLRAGDIPAHFRECSVCGRAVLTLRHDLMCATGKCYIHEFTP